MKTVSGWWFGTCFLFFHILGMSSSQLTFIFFRGVAQPPTRYCWWVKLAFFKSGGWLRNPNHVDGLSEYLPSWKRLHNYGIITMLLMGKLTISMAIFHSYVKLPEGILLVGKTRLFAVAGKSFNTPHCPYMSDFLRCF